MLARSPGIGPDSSHLDILSLCVYQQLRKRWGFTHPKCRKSKTAVIQLVPRIGCTYDHGHCEECQRTGYGGYKGNSHHSYHSSASYKQSDPDAKGAHESTGCHQTWDIFFRYGKTHDKMADCPSKPSWLPEATQLCRYINMRIIIIHYIC